MSVRDLARISMGMCWALSVGITPCQAYSFVLGPNVVFFDPGSTRITDKQKKQLDHVVRDWREHHLGMVMIAGHTDRTDSVRRHKRLGCARAAAARDYLIAHGVPADRILIGGRGRERPLVEPGSNLSSAPNRRAEITWGPDDLGPGSAGPRCASRSSGTRPSS